MTQHVDALIVGAGVVGLTTAISLAEAGLATRVQAAAPAGQTTSITAGAIWGPVRCGPPDKCREWARVGLEVLSELAADPSAAIRDVSGVELSRRPLAPPQWLDLLPSQRLLGDGEIPDGFASGWRYTAPVVTMPEYLAYLVARYARAGGSVEIAPVTSLAALDAPVIVNCTGIGARDLVPDPEVIPVRGQVVVVRNPGIDEFYIDRTGGVNYTYIFPHKDVVILGGTAEEGASDMAPRPSIAMRILSDCVPVQPRLRGAEVVTHRVGLRPCRPQVRLEAEALGGGRGLWHNYGHGGAGVTLAWGCARELTEAVVSGGGSKAARPVIHSG